MTHSYKVSGITCDGCVEKVKSQLLKHPHILAAVVSLPDDAVITMDKHISVNELQETIGADSKYRIAEDDDDHTHHAMQKEAAASWFKTYKPLIIIFLFITGIAFLSANTSGQLNGMLWMQYFMAGFFLTFSFFKFLDLKGFADSYAMYDVLAKRIYNYGFIYPFIELALGIAYLSGFNMEITNIATIIVMGFSSIGVIESVVNKKKIQCACLGAVFNLPMSTVTIIEDLLMVVMAAGMLFIN